MLARRQVGGRTDDGACPLARRRVGGGEDDGMCSMVLTAGRMTVLRHCRPSLAHWCDDKLVVGPMVMLPHWRNDVSAAGRKAVLAHSLAPSGNGSTAVDILGPNCDWLDGGSLRGPLLMRPGKGGKIPKSSAGRSATAGAASPVQTRSRPPGRLNVTFVNVKPSGRLGRAGRRCVQ